MLPMLTFGDGPKLVVAVHGITASAMEWPPVARRLSAEWTVVAPDLRGRGGGRRPTRPVRVAPSRGLRALRPDTVAEAARRRPDVTIETVADANHYTIVLADRFAARIAHHIAAGGIP